MAKMTMDQMRAALGLPSPSPPLTPSMRLNAMRAVLGLGAPPIQAQRVPRLRSIDEDEDQLWIPMLQYQEPAHLKRARFRARLRENMRYASTTRLAGCPRDLFEQVPYDRRVPKERINEALVMTFKAEARRIAKTGLTSDFWSGWGQWWTEFRTSNLPSRRSPRIYYSYDPETDLVRWKEEMRATNSDEDMRQLVRLITPEVREAIGEIEDAATEWYRTIRERATPPLPPDWMPTENYPESLTGSQWEAVFDAYSVNYNDKNQYAKIKKAFPLDGRLWVWPGGQHEKSPALIAEIVPASTWSGGVRPPDDRLSHLFPGLITPYGQQRRGIGVKVRGKMHVYTGATLLVHRVV